MCISAHGKVLRDFPNNCVIIGAGNVAYSLAPALEKAGVKVLQICSRSIKHACEIAERTIGAQPVSSYDEIIRNAGLYIVCTKDEAIAEVASANENKGGLWVHTSGSISKDILSCVTESYGVIYPMQTFTKGIDVDFKKIPVFIEASDKQTESELFNLAMKLSENVSVADGTVRKRIHAAAVFACNFVNFLWTNADDILHSIGYNIDLLFPLIQETWNKIHKISAFDAQTGPARRGDKRVMNEHLNLLSNEQKAIYKFLSEQIIKHYSQNECDKL